MAVRYRCPIPAAFRRRHAVGASRRRGNRDGRAENRHQPQLGFGYGVRLDQLVAEYYPATKCWSQPDDGNPVLSFAGHVARAYCRRFWKNRSSAAGAWSCNRPRRSAPRRSMRICGPTATIRFCRTPHGAPAMRRTSPSSSIEEGNPNQCQVPDRQRGAAGRLRQLRTGGAGLQRRR